MVRIIIGLVLVLTVLATVAFVVVPPYLERSFNKVLPHEPYRVSEEARTFHNTLTLGDLHADSLLWRRNILSMGQRGHVDIPRLLVGGYGLQVFSAVTKSPDGQNYENNSGDSDRITGLVMAQSWPRRTWGSLYERAVYQAEKLHRFAARSDGHLRVIRSRNDLQVLRADQASGTNVVGGLLATEGSHALEERLEAIDDLWDAGYRMMGLHHFFDNALGGSLHGQSQEGLSVFGRQAVNRMAEKGVIIDLAHSSEAVVRDVLDMGVRGIVVSHTGFKGDCDTPRNISDELMLSIAEAGGLIGVGFWDAAVCGTAPQDVAEAIVYGITLVGADHVALGSDYDGAVTVGFDSAESVALTGALLNAGLERESIEAVMGANLYAFLDRHLPR